MKAKIAGHREKNLSDETIQKALALGASLAGAAEVDRICRTPSYETAGLDFPRPDARSVIVLALEHGENDLSMDWWDGNHGTRGNRKLIVIAKRLKRWLKKKHGVIAEDIPYHIVRGGIFLKDAAVCAGIGIIGKNNLVITPRYGPRVRLRALFTDADMDRATDLSNFAPCETCDAPCREACPQSAFESGAYDSAACKKQMKLDEIKSRVSKNVGTMFYAGVWIRYCRACELACPAGRPTA